MSEVQRLEVFAAGEVLAALYPREGEFITPDEPLGWTVAGAEFNAIVGLSRLRHSTAFVTAVGDDPFGGRIRRVLSDEGVLGHLDPGAAGPTGVFFRELSIEGGRCVYYYRAGTAASRVSPGFAIGALRRSRPRYFLASGLTLGLGNPGGLQDAIRACLAEADSLGCQVVFDANLRPGIWWGDQAADEFFSGLVGQVDHLLAGDEELEALAGDTSWRRAAKRLLASGVTSVVVKHGSRGSTVFSAGDEWAIPAVRSDAVDSIGAGDAYLAGYVSGLLRGLDFAGAGRLGSVLGAHAVAARGDWESLPTLEDVEGAHERV